MSFITSRNSAIIHTTTSKTSFVAYLVCMVMLRRQRKALLNLNADQLDDIGISAQDAPAEAAQPIWNVPAHWKN